MSEDNFYTGRPEGEPEENHRGEAGSAGEENAYGQEFYREAEPVKQGEYRQDTGYQGQSAYQSMYQEPQKPASQAFGIASMAIGIISLVFFCSCINIPLAIMAFIFGVIQLTKPETSKVMPIVGIITSALSVILFVVLMVFTLLSTDFTDRFEEEFEREFDKYYSEYQFPHDDEDRHNTF